MLSAQKALAVCLAGSIDSVLTRYSLERHSEEISGYRLHRRVARNVTLLLDAQLEGVQEGRVSTYS